MSMEKKEKRARAAVSHDGEAWKAMAEIGSIGVDLGNNTIDPSNTPDDARWSSQVNTRVPSTACWFRPSPLPGRALIFIATATSSPLSSKIPLKKSKSIFTFSLQSILRLYDCLS
jgi:hypothetical protein